MRAGRIMPRNLTHVSWCLFLAAFPPTARAQNWEQESAAAFAKAEELSQKGQHAAAVAAYKKIAETWPTTGSGSRATWRSQLNSCIGWRYVLQHGPSENRVDVVVMGDGFTLEQQNAFDDMAKTVHKTFEKDTVLAEYFTYHNFVRANVVSKEDGLDGYGRAYDTALGGHVIDIGRAVVGVDGRLVHRMLKEVPGSDGLSVVFVKKGTGGTGGGGIATVGGRADETLIHEWGHAFGGLGDEYVDRTHRGEGHDGINTSSTGDKKKVPWKHWIEAGAPGIGAYEGANGMQRGAWRPTASGCMMEDSSGDFCRVCREGLVLRIYQLVDPIESVTPKPEPNAIPCRGESLLFQAKVLQPKRHTLDVRWYVFADGKAPAEPAGPARSEAGSRSTRGPLAAITDRPAAVGVHSWRFDSRGLKPGRYCLILRVRDTTKVSDDLLPWVLKDDRGVLESERRWWISVKS
jgi:hypothetical protein